MPRKKRGGASLAGYFKQVFDENPQWLMNKSNKEVIQRYNADHPGKPANARIKANLANVKSVLRRGDRGKSKGKAGKGGPADNIAAPTNLEVLEIAIDDCLIMAANLDRRGLDRVMDHLRRARNIVVWKSGK